VGAGHLVRGLAIQRGLGRAGFAGTYRMFGPTLPFPAARLCPGYETVPIQTDPALYDRHLAQTSDLAERLRDFAPDLLIVDLFWAPLRWVLPALKTEAWLLLRTFPPPWLTGPLQSPFDPTQFERIVAIEPVSHAMIDDEIDPIVIANPDECQPPEALRERLGIPPGEKLTVVLHAGERGETEDLLRHAGTDRPTVLDLFEEKGFFPAAEWLGGADHVVSGAGYNAFWEARWLGYAGRTTLVAFHRSIDNQLLRARELWHVRPRENGADVLARWIVI